MKLAVLGGSFNPIHLGHLYLADSALAAFRFDRLLLVPANISPFKVSDTLETADRLDMILASITGDPRLSADDLELRRGGVSYTIDTLQEIIRRYRPEGKPALILGDDLAADFSRWKDAEEIARIADIIIARRMLTAGGAVTGGAGKSFPFPHKTLDNEVMDLSSAMVRERIAAGKAWRYLVPRGARLIIEERGLYGVNRTGVNQIRPGIIAQVEDAARESLSAKRFIHSRNTALLARDIALRYGLDDNAAYLAGIAHDMAKSLKPALRHGKAAAVLLRKRFGIHNSDILEAVEFHTTGKADMGNLAKAVFIADKIEFSRGEGQARFREMALGEGPSGGAGLDQLFYAVLEDNVGWLKETGIKAAEETLQLLEKKQLDEATNEKGH